MNHEALKKILEYMHQNNFDQQANELEVLAAQYYNSTNEQKENVRSKIKQMCHPKWLGDFFIPGITQKEWFRLLDRLSKSV